MTTIIMTSPSNFSIDYSINPWMNDDNGTLNKSDYSTAIQQWNQLRDILIDAGVVVTTMPTPPKNCPDAVFTANAGFLFNGTFIPSFFRHPERQVEEPYFIDWFTKHGFHVPAISGITDRDHISFEGAGDALIDSTRGLLWLGHGFRSTENFKDVLAANIGTALDIKTIKLVDESFYHLDTCFCPLDTGYLLWYPAAFDDASQELIRSVYGKASIEASADDSAVFACNAISIDYTIVLPCVSQTLLDTLINTGHNPITHNLSEFLKSGGSAKCLILKVQ